MKCALMWGMSLLLALGCGKTQHRSPEWVSSLPSTCEAAVSIQVGWALDHPQFQAFLARYPQAEQALELTLKKAQIIPSQETGRVTFFALPNRGSANFLLRLGGFKEPRALSAALIQAFPQEGTLEIQRKVHPLMVILDMGSTHLRAIQDEQGTLWIGELTALTDYLNSRVRVEPALVQAAEWIDPEAPLQVYLNPQALLEGAAIRGDSDARDLRIPRGITSLFWSTRPLPGPAYRMEMALSGSPEGIRQVVPWLQKFVALAASSGDEHMPPPELSQAAGRAGLRFQLTETQFKAVLTKLNMPSITREKVPHP